MLTWVLDALRRISPKAATARKVEVLRGLVGSRVTLYIGAKLLTPITGFIVSVDPTAGQVRLREGRDDFLLMLNQVIALGDEDGRVTMAF